MFADSVDGPSKRMWFCETAQSQWVRSPFRSSERLCRRCQKALFSTALRAQKRSLVNAVEGTSGYATSQPSTNDAPLSSPAKSAGHRFALFYCLFFLPFNSCFYKLRKQWMWGKWSCKKFRMKLGAEEKWVL